nr:hypothetical protein [Tanacetum cinerariifolium]
MKDMREADVIFGIMINHESNRIYISPSHYIEKLEFYGVITCLMYATSCRRPGIAIVVDKLIRMEPAVISKWNQLSCSTVPSVLGTGWC